MFAGPTRRDDQPMLHKTFLTAAVSFAMFVPAAASADNIVQTFKPSPIRAYRDAAIWSTAPQGTKSFTLMRNGQPLAVTSTGDPVDADLSRGPDGTPTVVVARADGLYLLNGASLQRVVHRKGAHAPTLWGNRLAWVEGRGTISTATIGRSGVHRVPSPARGAQVCWVKLVGQRLAIAIHPG